MSIRFLRPFILLLLFSMIVVALALPEWQSALVRAQTAPVTPPTLPTPTPNLTTEFIHPKDGDAVAGTVPIFGSTVIPNCQKYQLYISIAGYEGWQYLTTVGRCVLAKELYRLESKKFADGYYDLRLRAIRYDGNYVDAFLRNLEIRNSFPPTPTAVRDALGVELPTPTSTLLPVATVTQRPQIVHQIPGGQGIFQPEIGDTVRGYLDIVGTVNGYPGSEFERYEVALSPAGQGQWNFLYQNSEQFWQSVLYTLDTTRFADGYYDLRLRIVYRDSNYDEYILRYLNIANRSAPAPVRGNLQPTPPSTTLGINAPLSNSSVSGLVEVRGVALDPSFLRWELYWSPSGGENWMHLISGQTPVLDRPFARLDFSGLANTYIDLRLRIVRQDYNYSEFFVRNIWVAPLPTPTPTQPVSPLR